MSRPERETEPVGLQRESVAFLLDCTVNDQGDAEPSRLAAAPGPIGSPRLSPVSELSIGTPLRGSLPPSRGAATNKTPPGSVYPMSFPARTRRSIVSPRAGLRDYSRRCLAQ